MVNTIEEQKEKGATPCIYATYHPLKCYKAAYSMHDGLNAQEHLKNLALQ